jgi:hypothetical protein
MSEERLEQVEQKLDTLIRAIRSGFGGFEDPQFNRSLSQQIFLFPELPPQVYHQFLCPVS